MSATVLPTPACPDGCCWATYDADLFRAAGGHRAHTVGAPRPMFQVLWDEGAFADPDALSSDAASWPDPGDWALDWDPDDW